MSKERARAILGIIGILLSCVYINSVMFCSAQDCSNSGHMAIVIIGSVFGLIGVFGLIIYLFVVAFGDW